MENVLLGLLGIVFMAAAGNDPAAGQTVCSVLDPRPCNPTFCSVFETEPCMPDILYPFGQGLRLTVQSRSVPAEAAGKAGKLNTIQDMYAALRACWLPPPIDQARAGMEISVRFSFNRAGGIIGEPRFTYSTPAVAKDVKAAYQRAVAAMLGRCAPLPFTDALGAALAGRPLSIRFIDDRAIRRPETPT